MLNRVGQTANQWDRVALRILYIGPAENGSCRARREALEQLGYRIRVINPYHYVNRIPLLSNIEMKTQFGPGVLTLNRKILRVAEQESFDWVWVDKGTFVFPGTIKTLCNRNVFTIHHLTDDFLNPDSGLRHYLKAIPDYHVHLTSNIYNVDELKEFGASAPILTHLGFDPNICCPGARPPEPSEKYKSDVVFIGHWRKHLNEFLMPLIEENIDIKLWGVDWGRSPNRKRLRGHAMFRIASEEEYPIILASAKVALCFLSHDNRNTSTQRSFEIPAIGTFMLGERTEEHLSFFEEGKEVEFFDSPGELLEKIRYYLHNDQARNRVSRAGHYRAMNSKYSYFDRIVMDLNNIMPIYQGFLAGLTK